MMSAGASPSDPSSIAADALQPVRMRGGFRLAARAEAGETRLVELEERGGFRVRFPFREAAQLEAVTINTGGGIIGGDRVVADVEAESGDLVVTSQAAERIYRSLGPASEIDLALRVGAGARLDWLPQETILFSGARVRRRFTADVAADGSLLMAELIVFGRAASGETLGEGAIADTWRLQRGGKLVFADNLRLDGDIGRMLQRPAVADGARASATIVLLSSNAPDMLDRVRQALENAAFDWGASSWNGMLVVRAIARQTADLRRGIAVALTEITGRALPRVWST